MRMRLAILFLFGTVWPIVTPAQQVAAASIAAATQGMARHQGFMPFFWDSARGRVLLEVPAFDRDVCTTSPQPAAAVRSSCRWIGASCAAW